MVVAVKGYTTPYTILYLIYPFTVSALVGVAYSAEHNRRLEAAFAAVAAAAGDHGEVNLTTSYPNVQYRHTNTVYVLYICDTPCTDTH